MPKSKTVIKSKAINNPPMIVNNQPTMFDSIKQGFGFGLGSSIAHNVVRSFTESSPTVEKPQISCIGYDKCKLESDPFDCFSKLDQNLYNHCKK
jgi:hypothetical protein